MVNLKKLRDAEGLSQKSLANQLGLTQQSIHSYENDIYEPDIKTLKLIANFSNTSVDYHIATIPPKLATGGAATPYRAGFPPTITSDLARPLLTLTQIADRP